MGPLSMLGQTIVSWFPLAKHLEEGLDSWKQVIALNRRSDGGGGAASRTPAKPRSTAGEKVEKATGGGVGRKAEALLDLYTRELTSFSESGAAGLHFGQKWSVKARNIRRYQARCCDDLKIAITDAEKKLALKAKHTFTMIDSCQKMVSAAKLVKEEKAPETWMEHWKSLQSYLDDKPDVVLKNTYIWQTHLDYFAQYDPEKYPLELSKFKLLERGLITDIAQAATYQASAVKDLLTGLFQKPLGDEALIKAIRSRVTTFLAPECLTLLDACVVKGVRAVNLLCQDSAATQSSTAAVKQMEELLQEIDSKGENVPDITSHILKFKAPAKVILKHAKKMCAHAAAELAQAGLLQEKMTLIQSIASRGSPTLNDFQDLDASLAWVGACQGRDNEDYLTFFIDFDKALANLCSHYIVVWATFFKDGEKWANDAANELPGIIVMGEVLAKVVGGYNKGGTGDGGLPVHVLKICKLWFDSHGLISKAIREPEGLSCEDSSTLIALSKLAPMQQWREALSIVDSTDSTFGHAVKVVNEHFSSIQESRRSNTTWPMLFWGLGVLGRHVHIIALGPNLIGPPSAAPAPHIFLQQNPSHKAFMGVFLPDLLKGAFEAKFANVRSKLAENVSGDMKLASDGFELCRSFVQDSTEEFFGAEQSLRDQVIAMNLDESFKKLRLTTSVGEVEEARVEYLSRYCVLAKSFALVGKLGAGIPDDFQPLLAAEQEMNGFSEFLKTTVREKWSSMETASFKPQLGDGKTALSWAAGLVNKAHGNCASSLDEVSNFLKESTPSDHALNNADMLTEKSLQNRLFLNPVRNELNGKVQLLQNRLAMIKKAQTVGIKINKQLKDAYKYGMEMRAHGKLTILMDWCLDQVLNDAKATPPEIAKQGLEMKDMLVRTNVNVPKFMEALIDGMSKADSPAPATTDGPASSTA